MGAGRRPPARAAAATWCKGGATAVGPAASRPAAAYLGRMRFWLGVVTFLSGAVVWFLTAPTFARPGRPPRPAWLARFGLALGALGLSVLASTRPGFGWTISSICFSLIAIVLLVWVLRDNVRR